MSYTTELSTTLTIKHQDKEFTEEIEGQGKYALALEEGNNEIEAFFLGTDGITYTYQNEIYYSSND